MLETHFKMVDCLKEILLSSDTEDRENNVRRTLEIAKENEKFIFID